MRERVGRVEEVTVRDERHAGHVLEEERVGHPMQQGEHLGRSLVGDEEALVLLAEEADLAVVPPRARPSRKTRRSVLSLTRRSSSSKLGDASIAAVLGLLRRHRCGDFHCAIALRPVLSST